MSGIDIKIDQKQVDLFMKWLEEYPEMVKNFTHDLTNTLRDFAIGRTPFGINYEKYKTGPRFNKKAGKKTKGRWKPSGQARRSWGAVAKIAEGAWSFSLDLPYASVLEGGTYKGVGPRTAQFGQGIFSSQAPGGMIKPMLEGDESPLGAGKTLESAAEYVKAALEARQAK
jgi:hypothetical protein